jgi:NOL1/NOP2/fmu family ribosome biogenesis protein
MEHLTALNAKRIKELKAALLTQFGFSGDLPYIFYMSNKDRIYAATPDLSLLRMEGMHIDALGLYIGTWEEGVRLSLEGAQLVGPGAAHHVLQLNDEEVEEYLKGNPFDLQEGKNTLANGIYLVQHGKDFIGCCKLSLGKLYNFMPKSRRIKVLNR